MGKLVLNKDFQKQLPNIVMLSGGPGLGPNSFFPLGNLLEAFNVHYFYPMGTDGGILDRTPTYDELLIEIQDELSKLDSFYLCGHSFGGIQAVELAQRNSNKVLGLICLSTPLSLTSFERLGQNFLNLQLENDKTVDEALSNDPTDENYLKWFEHYARLYFAPSKIQEGIKMLSETHVSVRNFIGARGEAEVRGELVGQLEQFPFKKLMIGGERDSLFDTSCLIQEARRGHCPYQIIKNAGHFVHFDQPELTAQIIMQFIYSRR